MNEVEDGRGGGVVDKRHRQIVEPDVLLLRCAGAVGLRQQVPEAVEDELGCGRADGLLHPLLEGVVEVGARRRTVERGRGVAAVVVGRKGVGVAAVAYILRDLPARKVGEAAGVAGGRDRRDLVGGGRIGVGLRGAAEDPRQPVADPVIAVALGAVGAARAGNAVEIVVGQRLRPARYQAIGDPGDVASGVKAVRQVLDRARARADPGRLVILVVGVGGR